MRSRLGTFLSDECPCRPYRQAPEVALQGNVGLVPGGANNTWARGSWTAMSSGRSFLQLQSVQRNSRTGLATHVEDKAEISDMNVPVGIEGMEKMSNN